LGREGRLRVAPERETPLHQSPQAGAPFRHIEKDRSTVAGQASGSRSGDAYPYTSQRMLAGTVVVTDKNILPPNFRAVACPLGCGSSLRWDE